MRSPSGQVRALTIGQHSYYFLDRYDNASQVRADIREEAGHRLVICDKTRHCLRSNGLDVTEEASHQREDQPGTHSGTTETGPLTLIIGPRYS
jgi:hypothetical protein